MSKNHQNSSTTTFLKFLQNIPVRHGMLTHQYYAERWTKGQLTEQGMRLYCQQNRIEQLFQECLCVLKNRSTKHPAIHEVISQNLQDEQGHIELWLKFTGNIDVKPQDIARADPFPGTQNFIETFRHFTYAKNENIWASIGALYAFEAQMPKIAAAKLEALDCHYGSFFKSLDAAAEYYKVHQEADEKHAAWWLELFEEHCLAIDDRKAALRGAHIMALALIDLLEGIHRADKTYRFMDTAFLSQRFPVSTAAYQPQIAVNA